DLGGLNLEVGKPVKVMLAQKAKTIKEGFEKVGKPCAIEYKYDGFRLLIHKKDNDIKLYTRRLENVSKQFPEVLDYLKKYVKGNSFIIDSEAIGFDKKTKKYKPFQEISQRIKRKYDIEKLQEELPVEINVFDILYYNGKTLLQEPFSERTALLRKIVQNQKYKLKVANQIITDDEKKADQFFKQALADNQEGVMMKNLDSIYQPGSRVGYMLKVKPEEREMDLVIVGAEYGTGKRFGWMSSFILACKHGDEFLEIGKVGTGIKEKLGGEVSFDELTKILKPLIKSEQGRYVEIKPKIVVTVIYQEIQKSSHYQSGFALRFPRVTALRPDRNTEDVENLEQVKKDYESQGK
ncbi:MAG: ATP-dependent DNA ligase, partial [Candidatus Nanoarchaeia archaeon]